MIKLVPVKKKMPKVSQLDPGTVFMVVDTQGDKWGPYLRVCDGYMDLASKISHKREGHSWNSDADVIGTLEVE